MPGPQVYRYRLYVSGDPKLVDLLLFDERTKEVIFEVLPRVPKDIGLALVEILNQEL